MKNSIYETHVMHNAQLPFIFHRAFTVTVPYPFPNWHENIELLYCFDGNGIIQHETEMIRFSKGSIVVINSDVLHGIIGDPSVSYRCLIIDHSFFTENAVPILEMQFQSHIRDEKMNALFEEVTAAYDEYDGTRLCAAAAIRHAVLGLILHLCRHYAVEKPTVRPGTNEYVKRAVIYLRQNMASQISLDDVANHVGISKYYLSREFRVHTGSTIIRTLNWIRCTEAKRLIENGYSVSSAAITCGFENLSYFSRTFKKLFGREPSAYGTGEKTTEPEERGVPSSYTDKN